jgi:hypothetical protein
MQMQHVLQNAVETFLSRLRAGPGGGGNVRIWENPTEEIREAHERGKPLRLHAMPGQRYMVHQKDANVRYEENYLYSTRRFPNNTANDTIGSGAVTAGDYDFFGNGVGDAVTTMGWATTAGTSLTYLQTNMDKGGKIPQGRAFRLFEMGISFNARALTTNIAQCMDTLALRFEKQGGQLVIQHGPVRMWPGGTGASGYSTNTATEGAANGLPSLNSVRRFRLPRELDANESFKYTLNAPSATRYVDGTAIALTAFVEITIWLYGLTKDRIPS